jgi:hypothetical protein
LNPVKLWNFREEKISHHKFWFEDTISCYIVVLFRINFFE